jgi:predicted DNA-binding transcriptional regulator
LANDRVIGGGIFGGSILGIILYGLLVFYWPTIVLQLTAFIGFAVLFGILAWIGYTMATTPPPERITDIPDLSARPKQDSGEKPA